jgi:hypothetical protein
MANSNLIQRHPPTSLWLFITGMFAFSAFIIGLIFYLAEAHPGVLYDTLKLLCLQDHDLNHLVMKIDVLEHKTQSQEHRIQSMEHEVEVLKAEVHKANMQTTEIMTSGITVFLLQVLISALKNR